MSLKGLECPRCGYIPRDNEDNFKTIVTNRVRGKVIRAKVCPSCGGDFLSEEVATNQPFYKKRFINKSLNDA